MKHIPPPVRDTDTDYEVCCGNAKKIACRGALRAANADVIASHKAYSQNAAKGRLDRLKPLTGERDALRALLTNTYSVVSGKRRPLRALYNEILDSAPDGICPMCGDREATTVDHHLPKEIFGEFAAFAPNLVPSCKDCNGTKLSYTPTKKGEQLFHPYFDNEPVEVFLVAKITLLPRVIVHYEIDDALIGKGVFSERLKRHFAELKLGSFYSTKAAQALVDMKGRLETHFLAGGAAGVKADLRVDLNSCLAGYSGINGWKSAMYRALIASHPFCDGGFANIRKERAVV